MAKILIASMDGNLGYLLRKELEDEGHKIGRMPLGGELTAYLADHPAYDAVLIDLPTSCLSELKSLRSVKKICPHIHIIVFSDRVAPQERAALITNGVDRGFLKHELNALKEHLQRTFIGASPEAGPPADAVSEQELIGGSETILVAEDDATVRKFVATVLRSFGYTVIEAADGPEAITRFSEHASSIDLVLTDTFMPGKNGREAYREMKEIRPDVPALFTSGYSNEVLRKKSAIDDDLDFILKPVSPQKLLKRVREVLDRPRA